MTAEDRVKLGDFIRRHIVCGYLFAEYGYKVGRENQPSLASDKLFEMWVLAIYSPICNFDPRDKGEADVKNLWFAATGQPIGDSLQSHDATWQDIDNEILAHYFDGGMLLRMLEARPLTDAQVSNIATGGAYAAEKSLSAAAVAASASSTVPNPPRDGWPRLSDEVLAALPEHEQLIIRQHEEETIAGSKMQLADICTNCHIKPQFAKTYRVLRRDLRAELEKSRAAMARPNQRFSDAFGMAMIRSTDAIVSYKLSRMAGHFQMSWGEPIENWAGKEGSAMDKAGCVVAIVMLSFAAGSTAALCRLLLG